MKAGHAAALIAVIAVAAALFGLSIGKTLAPQGGGRTDKDRETLAVLVKDGSGCRAIKTNPARALRNDKFVFRIVDTGCSLGTDRIRIHFYGSNSSYAVPDESSGADVEGKLNNGEAKIRIKIRDFNGDKPPAGDGFWWFDYEIQYYNVGPNTFVPIGDPRLEVDPI